MFTKQAVEFWCVRCFTVTLPGKDGIVDPMSLVMRATHEIDSMGAFDWMALFFSTTVVAFAVTSELQDIELCMVAVRNAKGGATTRVRFAMGALRFLRRYVFLNCLVASIPVLVWNQGADALSVCFNTVAVLFICARPLATPTFVHVSPNLF